MHILSNKRRYKSAHYERMLPRLRALFPKYRMQLMVRDHEGLEIFNEVQLDFACKIVALYHTHESETERMEREAAARMAEASSDEEPPVTAEDDMTEEFFEALGFKHEHF